MQSSEAQLQSNLNAIANTDAEATVVLNADKSVPIEQVVNVMSMANKLKLKMILATQPE